MRAPVVSAALLALALAACGGRPTQVLAEAEGALADARLAEKCAPEEFAAAKKMLEKANKLADEGKNDEAEKAARAAKKLALQARNKAMLRKDECEKPQQQTAAVDPNQFVDKDQSAAVDNSIPSELKTVYFEYDSFDLSTEARDLLSKNAAWMKAHPTDKVVVSGHCDKRGSTEYNLALGEKRAQVVRNYLQSLGIDPARMSIISYGEEQPIDYGDAEDALARNRRAEFKAHE
jgi:peptidoglycan-associated lipoprotein